MFSPYKKSFEKVYKNPHIVFLLSASLFGVFFLIFVPPAGEPDEAQHFNRIYQIDNGYLLGQRIPGGKGSYIPESILNYEIGYITPPRTAKLFILPKNERLPQIKNLKQSSEDSINSKSPLIAVHFENTEIYNPVSYLPQVLTLIAAKVLNLSIESTFTAMRLAGFITWLAICYIGLKKMGMFGWGVIILILSPISLQLASSITADSLTIAATVLFVGILIEQLRIKTKLQQKQMLIMFAICVLLACVKPPYALLVLLLALIPGSQFKNGLKEKAVFLLITFMTVSIVFLSWNWLALSRQNNDSFRTVVYGIQVNQSANKQYLLHNPLQTTHKLFKTYTLTKPYNENIVLDYGGEMGLSSYHLPTFVEIFYLLSVVFCFAVLRSNARTSEYIRRKERLYISAILFILFMAINLGVFIIWSRTSYPTIEGLQSRYFIPLTVPLILCLLPIYKKTQGLSNLFYIFIITAIILVQTSAVMYALKIY